MSLAESLPEPDGPADDRRSPLPDPPNPLRDVSTSDPGDEPGGGGGDGDHLGWKISALLDDELSVTESIVARNHLAGCDRCQDEFAETLAARNFVRELGAVEPPSGYFERVITRGRRRRRSKQLGVVGLVTLALIWVLLLLVGVGLALPTVVPSTADLVDRHDAIAAQADAVPEGTVSPTDLAAPFAVPPTVGDWDRVAVLDGGDGVVQVVYQRDDILISVFEEEGLLGWEDLPEGGTEITVASGRAWATTTRDPSLTVVVVPSETLVYMLVGADEAAVEDLASQLPEPPGFSLGERVRRGFEDLVERLGLD